MYGITQGVGIFAFQHEQFGISLISHFLKGELFCGKKINLAKKGERNQL